MSHGITFSKFKEGLISLGVADGDALLVHCSMSSFGQIYGGAQTVIECLTELVGGEGTLVMPTLTNGRFDPSEWGNPPAPSELWDEIRYTTPLFDRQKTPCDHTMSSVYELFRTWPNAVRSNHPHSSFAAWGKFKDFVISTHRLDDRFGETSPLGKMYELDAKVLFLGTDFSTNTCFHLSEYQQNKRPSKDFKIVTEIDGLKSFLTYSDVNTDSSVFNKIGTDFKSEYSIREAYVGSGHCTLFSIRNAVDFATQWFSSTNV